MQIAHQIQSAEIDKWNAKNYKQNSSLQEKIAQYALSHLELKADDSVIDWGCGNGKNTYNISEQVNGSVVGVDFSFAMIRQARSDYEKPNLSFYQGDMTTFVLPDQKFNAGTAFSSLSWVKEQDRAFKNIAEALYSGGKFVGVVSYEKAPIIQAYYRAFTLDRWKNYFTNYAPSYYPCDKELVKQWLHDAQLEAITVKEVDLAMTMDEESFIKTLAATPGVKDVIPEESYKDFITDVMTQYVRIIPNTVEGKINIDLGLLLVLAQKQ